MKVTIIGSHLCQDTLYALFKLKDKKAETRFLNISTNFQVLKDYLKLRDTHPLYVEVKEKDLLGMPFFIFEDGTETLSLDEALAKL